MWSPAEIRSITPYPTRAECKRRYQFTLRGLFIVTAVVAAFAATTARWGFGGVFIFLLGAGILQIGRGIVKRRAGTIISGVCGMVMLFVVSLPFCGVAIWDGSRSVPLHFVVVDSTTRKPIQNATVRIRRDVDIRPNDTTVPTGEHGVQATTSSDGTVALSEEFWTSGREGCFEHRGWVHFCYYGENFWVQVSASGYKTEMAPLMDLTGQRRDIEDPVPPPLRIKLEPLGSSKLTQPNTIILNAQ